MAEEKKKIKCPRCGHRDIQPVHRSRCPRCGSPVGPNLPWNPELDLRRVPPPPL